MDLRHPHDANARGYLMQKTQYEVVRDLTNEGYQRMNVKSEKGELYYSRQSPNTRHVDYKVVSKDGKLLYQ